METLKSWKDYVVENCSYIVNEAWQLGVDAKSEAANLFTDLASGSREFIKFPHDHRIIIKCIILEDTGEIYTDLSTTDYWKVTEGEKKPENSPDETNTDEKNFQSDQMSVDNVKMNVFSVENFPPSNNNTSMAIIELEHNEDTRSESSQ